MEHDYTEWAKRQITEVHDALIEAHYPDIAQRLDQIDYTAFEMATTAQERQAAYAPIQTQVGLCLTLLANECYKPMIKLAPMINQITGTRFVDVKAIEYPEYDIEEEEH